VITDREQPMQIQVNGKPREVASETTIAALLETLNVPLRGLAVERNLELVPRAEHATTKVADGDRIEVVTLVGGG
jgi:sulfur carrier protein